MKKQNPKPGGKRRSSRRGKGRARRTLVPEHASRPPIVGIGASAGGLEAFSQLVRHLRADTGLAYVLLQHLDPDRESMLPELIGRAASVPVIEVQNGTLVEADHVYIIPPNTMMTVTDGHLQLTPGRTSRGRRTLIDDFMRSLADMHGSGAVGVILSGAGSDGARGIEAIKAEGGITMAQDPASARFPSMPESAIATGHVDFVLPPEELAQQLAKIGRHTTGGASTSSDSGAASGDPADELQKILVLLKDRTGVDFRHYRRGTVQRRVLRRMLMHRRDTRKEYLAHIRANPAELDALYEDLLIGVTRFFRDPAAFVALKQRAFPEMMKGRGTGKPIRVWVAGCAGGEETYSVAIALLEYLGDAAAETAIQIFGTDLSDVAIRKARAGRYPVSIEADLSAERLGQFFVKEGGGYRVTKRLRDLCVFARQNVVRDPPLSQLDLVTCRNVLIYFESGLQQRVIPIFHYALKSNGILVLGSSESVRAAPAYFTQLDKRHKIFRRRGNPRHLLDAEPTPSARATAGDRTSQQYNEPPLPDAGVDEVQREADRLVLDRFAPGGVVVNEQLEIVQFRGSAAGFLEHPPGAASLHLLKLARRELLRPLRAAIETASGEERSAREAHIVLRDGDARRTVAIEVIPFRANDARLFVVVFETEPTTPRSPSLLESRAGGRAAGAGKGAAADGKARHDGSADGPGLRGLREQLAAAKRHIRDITDEHEAANEELRAANEEIQSSNEELQSTNEELETTKEEIQATNEELTTVNDELRERNQELALTSADLTNIMSSTQVPIIIVDSDLRLRRFTPAAEHMMRVIASDAGRPLSDVKLRVDVPDLERRIASAIETLRVTEQEVQDDQGHWWSLTIRPYWGPDKTVQGAMLVLNDIHASKLDGARAEDASEVRRKLLVAAEQARTEADEARSTAETANRAKGSFLASMSHDLRTPLNAIGGYVELLERGIHGPVSEPQLEDLARIKNSARHLLSLINDILNFTRVEAGRLEFRPTDVVLDQALRSFEELIMPQLRAKALVYDGEGCDAMVQADPERLQQILLNLATNAIKFTPRGGHIGVRCSAAADFVHVEVADTGIGIAPSQLDRIFEPFVQVRSFTSRDPEGVGLGLAISRELARGMGGDLTVQSTLGEGSRFTLTLPRAGTSDPAAPA